VTEYDFKDGIGNTTYILVIKNNTKKPYDFQGHATAFDSNGKKAEVDGYNDYDRYG
jgi:hypothetical protein